MMNCRTNRTKKEKPHVVDYHCNTSNPVAARLFRREHKSKFSENRQLDPYPDRYCRHPHYFAGVGNRVGPSPVENTRGDPHGALLDK